MARNVGSGSHLNLCNIREVTLDQLCVRQRYKLPLCKAKRHASKGRYCRSNGSSPGSLGSSPQQRQPFLSPASTQPQGSRSAIRARHSTVLVDSCGRFPRPADAWSIPAAALYSCAPRLRSSFSARVHLARPLSRAPPSAAAASARARTPRIKKASYARPAAGPRWRRRSRTSWTSSSRRSATSTSWRCGGPSSSRTTSSSCRTATRPRRSRCPRGSTTSSTTATTSTRSSAPGRRASPSRTPRAAASATWCPRRSTSTRSTTTAS